MKAKQIITALFLLATGSAQASADITCFGQTTEDKIKVVLFPEKPYAYKGNAAVAINDDLTTGTYGKHEMYDKLGGSKKSLSVALGNGINLLVTQSTRLTTCLRCVVQERWVTQTFATLTSANAESIKFSCYGNF